MDSATGCPTASQHFTAYEEMFQTYFGLVRSIVLKGGIAPEDVEDVSMEIITKFFEKGALEKYDPQRLHEIPGKAPRTAKFNGMLTGFTRTYVMGYRSKQAVRHRREPFRLQHPTSDGGEYGDQIEAPPVLDDLDVAVSIRQAVQAARRELALRQNQNPKSRDYLACFDLLIEEGYMAGRLKREDAAERLGVTVRVVGQMIREIKRVLSTELESVQVALP